MTSKKKKIAVIGGGPAGLMAAIAASEAGATVTIFEKMRTCGKKLSITGKGRCNITNANDIPEIIKNIRGNGKFLYSTLCAFDNQEVMNFFTMHGVDIKIERGARVFPASDKAQDVLNALLDVLAEQKAKLRLEEPVQKILVRENKVQGIQTVSGKDEAFSAVILAVGGASYPATGSSGDGYRIAKDLGLSLIQPLPALVPLETEELWVKDLQGLSLRNVRATLLIDGKKKESHFGEMMFTHFGVTGPIVLSLSRTASFSLYQKSFVELSIDLKPALTLEQLDRRVQRDFEKYQKKEIKNALVDLLPNRLIFPILDQSYISLDKFVYQITKKERLRLVHVLKNLLLTIRATRPLKEAIVTMGGIDTKEIDPKTMASKRIKGLYFAGEVVDIDAFTGGYNLQAAFSMGRAAGFWSAQKVGV